MMQKKTKRLIEVLTRKFIKRVFEKTLRNNSDLNQSRSPLIHGQINLIKFVESNKFDKVNRKI